MIHQSRITNQIRKHLTSSHLSTYRICKDTGLDQANLSRFIRGRQGISVETIEKLSQYLNLNLTKGHAP